MTICVAITNGTRTIMGCDSMISDGITKSMSTLPKIVKRNNLLIGVAGSLSTLNKIYFDYEPSVQNCPDKEYFWRVANEIKGLTGDDDYSILLATGKTLGTCSQHMDMEFPAGYTAIGSGYAYALGCLFPYSIRKKQHLTAALNAASLYDAGCGGSYTYLTIS